eukprot:COSAG01_NODE_5783_length_4035_cov_4.057673_2_plen_221_part_00
MARYDGARWGAVARRHIAVEVQAQQPVQILQRVSPVPGEPTGTQGLASPPPGAVNRTTDERRRRQVERRHLRRRLHIQQQPRAFIAMDLPRVGSRSKPSPQLRNRGSGGDSSDASRHIERRGSRKQAKKIVMTQQQYEEGCAQCFMHARVLDSYGARGSDSGATGGPEGTGGGSGDNHKPSVIDTRQVERFQMMPEKAKLARRRVIGTTPRAPPTRPTMA